MSVKQQYAFPCTECQAGVMRMTLLTYFTWLNEELVTVPNFPAWVCDVCGRRHYDERAINWLAALLTPEAGKPSHPAMHPGRTKARRDSSRPHPE
ncbi:MAG: YgiT-type zinc finger protein [Chloroflexota bacterium]